MSEIRYNWDLVAANVLFGANFSCFVSLVKWIDFRALFLFQVVTGALFFIPNALCSPATYRIRHNDLIHIVLIADETELTRVR